MAGGRGGNKPLGRKEREHEINGEIRDREVRVINADGSQMGVMQTRDALKLAEDQNLDLVKIAPQANPPVVKVLDYGKFRFDQQKKEKEAKKNQKVVEIKEIRLGLHIDIGDFNTKLGHAKKFLEAGHKLKVSIRFRGREMAHPAHGLDVHRRFAEALPEAVVEKPPKLEGRQMIMFLAPIKEQDPPKAKKKPAEDAPKPAPEKAEQPAGGGESK
ncbi:translation initiation factor IF-3 [Ruminococcaceae bacterium OttesenSCG-928-A11]|nr:translation initiation factor IF-3 [Ruminococcaceae bacterium OttesenSCG-928-A11]